MTSNPTLSFCFNTQPPEGGWDVIFKAISGASVSTHSRLKAAGYLPGLHV